MLQRRKIDLENSPLTDNNGKWVQMKFNSEVSEGDMVRISSDVTNTWDTACQICYGNEGEIFHIDKELGQSTIVSIKFFQNQPTCQGKPTPDIKVCTMFLSRLEKWYPG